MCSDFFYRVIAADIVVKDKFKKKAFKTRHESSFVSFRFL